MPSIPATGAVRRRPVTRLLAVLAAGLVPAAANAVPVTLELSREAVEERLESAGAVTGPARLVAADVGAGAGYATGFVKPGAPGADLHYATAAYGDWSRFSYDGRFMTLADAVARGIYFEYTLEFEEDIERVTGITLHYATLNRGSPGRMTVVARDGRTIEEPTKAIRFGHTVTVSPIKSRIVSAELEDFAPVWLTGDKTLTVRVYAWSYQTDGGPIGDLLLDRIELQVRRQGR